MDVLTAFTGLSEPSFPKRRAGSSRLLVSDTLWFATGRIFFFRFSAFVERRSWPT